MSSRIFSPVFLLWFLCSGLSHTSKPVYDRRKLLVLASEGRKLISYTVWDVTPRAPVTNPTTPTTTDPTITNPVMPPPPTTGPPNTWTPPGTLSGRTFCIASPSASEAALQAALDYACGFGADCSALQSSGSCYNPNSVKDHASYAFNSYYQRNPVQTSCNFGGTAVITTADPSTGSCPYPSSGTSASVSSPSILPPTPTTETSANPPPAPTYGGSITPSAPFYGSLPPPGPFGGSISPPRTLDGTVTEPPRSANSASSISNILHVSGLLCLIIIVYGV